MKPTRIAFFADLHIRGDELHSQTDFGAASRVVPRKARDALNDIAPDYVFGLGDLTADSAPDDWRGYKRWVNSIDAPIVDLFGNHDRDYTVFASHNYGEEYYSVLGRVTDTQALRVGNTIFILISEEHNPEGNPTRLTSTVPAKRFQFLESILKEYSSDHNVFVLSHTLLRSTTALSDQWSFNDTRMWTSITKKFFRLFREYPVVGHITGHTHIDYRYRARVRDLDGAPRKRKEGKFVDGRAHDSLPDVMFLNMPCVDTAHGWVGSNFAVLRELGKSTAKAKKSPFRKLFMSVEEKGPPLFDILYQSPISNILGRAAVYYIDLIPDRDYLTVTTRWLRKNRDVERYPVHLRQSPAPDDCGLELLASDLSIRSKKNLAITLNDWFAVPAEERGSATFSQSYPKLVSVEGLTMKASDLAAYTVRWKGSRNGGRDWSGQWQEDAQALGRVNAVMLDMEFQAGEVDAAVADIAIETNR